MAKNLPDKVPTAKCVLINLRTARANKTDGSFVF